MDKVAEGSTLGQVAVGGTTDMEDKGGGIVLRLPVEEPVADSSPAFTIPTAEVRPCGGMGNKSAVGIGGASWGGGTNMGGQGIP